MMGAMRGAPPGMMMPGMMQMPGMNFCGGGPPRGGGCGGGCGGGGGGSSCGGGGGELLHEALLLGLGHALHALELGQDGLLLRELALGGVSQNGEYKAPQCWARGAGIAEWRASS